MTTNSRICSNKTTILYEDSFGNIWIGSMDAGISIFNGSTNTMTTLSHDPADPTSLSSNMIFTTTRPMTAGFSSGRSTEVSTRMTTAQTV